MSDGNVRDRSHSMKRPAQSTIVQHGGVPLPVGGVTVHIQQLVFRLLDDGYLVIVHDRAPGVKLESAATIVTGIRGLWNVILRRRAVHHVHVSYPTSWNLLGVLVLTKVLPRRRTCLTFHNGNFPSAYRSPWERAALTALSRRVTVWFALNEASAKRLRNMSKHAVIVPAISYVRGAASSRPEAIGDALDERISALRQEVDYIVVTSGYRVKNSRFDEVIVAAHNTGLRCGVVIVGYGESDEQYMRHVCLTLANVPGAMLEALPPRQFRSLLRAADIYVRHARADAYGIAVAEALEQGTPAVATNVCERSPGCVTYGVDDRKELSRLIASVLRTDSPQVGCPPDGYPVYRDVYLHLLMSDE